VHPADNIPAHRKNTARPEQDSRKKYNALQQSAQKGVKTLAVIAMASPAAPARMDLGMSAPP
jgi:hypothetical protein